MSCMQATRIDYSSNQAKYQHVMRQNSALAQAVKQFQAQVAALRKLNQLLVEKAESSLSTGLKEVNEHNSRLEGELLRLTVANSKYLCEILMKNQLICETNKQCEEIVKEYAEKIVELRQLVLRKEEHVISIQKKYALQKLSFVEKPTHSSLCYLGQIGDLKMYMDRLSIEYSQVRYANLLSEQQVANLRKRLHGYEITFKKMGLPQLQESKNSTAETSMLLQQSRQHARSKIQSEISKYDSNYQDLYVYKRATTTNPVPNMKLMITHLLNQNSNLLKQNIKLEVKDKNMAHNHLLLQQAYKKMQKICQHSHNQIELLRMNIKKMEQNFKKAQKRWQEAQNTHQNFERQKQLIQSYWKNFIQKQNWKKLSNKCILSIKLSKESKIKNRSKSFLPFFKYTKSPFDRQESTKELQKQCFSDILNICDEFNTMDKKKMKRQISSFIFDEDISMISKKWSNKYRSEQEADLKEIDLE